MKTGKIKNWHFIYIFIFLANGNLGYCQNNKAPSVDSTVSEDKVLQLNNITHEDVIKKAKIFLHLLKGNDAYAYYNNPNPKARPQVLYIAASKNWNVYFYHPISTLNFRLSDNIEKANCLYLNGSALTKLAGDKIDPYNPPLFTLNEFIELLELPHNNP